MIDLVIVGSTGLDDIETPAGKIESALGGSGIYASCAASFFTKPGLVSIAGTDLPEEHSEILNRVDLAGLERKGETFRWSGFYESDMNEAKTRKTEINSLGDFNPILPQDYRNASYLFLANTDPIQQLKVIEQMKSKPFIAVDTMNYWITSRKEELTKVLKRSSLIVMNEGEAKQYFETPNLILAGKMMLKLGAKYAIIKKGEHGALLFSKESYFSAPGYPLEELKDPTGAGDSFAGGLIGYLAKTGDISESNIRKGIIFGSTVASFCAENFSLGYLSKTKFKNIKERYNAFKKIRKF